MGLDVTCEQIDELKIALKLHPKPYVRTRALAILCIVKGMCIKEVANIVEADRHTVSRWIDAYKTRGLNGLIVKYGRGRKSYIDEVELLEIVKQSPKNFGLDQERWTLEAVRKTVPSLNNLSSLSSVMYILRRLGVYSLKNEQQLELSNDSQQQNF